MAPRTFQLLVTLLSVLAAAAGAGHVPRHRRAGWSCPTISSREPHSPSCQCDLAHTLRCTSPSPSDGAERQVAAILDTLRLEPKERFVSLLDLSIENLARLTPFAFDGVPLHGLVVSGAVAEVAPDAFAGLGPSLTALGLPNNRLTSVPRLASLRRLERLDLSNNRIRSIDADALLGLERLRYLDVSGNGLETLGPGAFRPVPSLRTLHLGHNRLDAARLDAGLGVGLAKLQELDLSANGLRGRLTAVFLQGLDSLVTLDLSANNFTLLKRGMLAGLKRLRNLRLARNQVTTSSNRGNNKKHAAFEQFRRVMPVFVRRST